MLSFTASQAQLPKDSVEIVYGLWSAEQRKAVLLHMQLDESEKMTFWPVYQLYCKAMEPSEVESLQIMELQRKYSKELKEKEVSKLYEELLENQWLQTKIRMQFYKKFQKALSPSRAAEFMELDHSLRTLFRLELQKNTRLTEISEAAVYSMSTQYVYR